jgi:hypothetical protein
MRPVVNFHNFGYAVMMNTTASNADGVSNCSLSLITTYRTIMWLC